MVENYYANQGLQCSSVLRYALVVHNVAYGIRETELALFVFFLCFLFVTITCSSDLLASVKVYSYKKSKCLKPSVKYLLLKYIALPYCSPNSRAATLKKCIIKGLTVKVKGP